MTTYRKVLDYWTETKRVVEGKVVSTTCCCGAPGSWRKACAIASGNKTPCRCACHVGAEKTYRKKKRGRA